MKTCQSFSFSMSPWASLGVTILLVALTSCGSGEVDRKIKEERAARAAAEEAAVMDRKNNMLRLMPYIHPRIDEYLSLPTKTKQGQAYIRGKVIPVSVEGKSIHSLYLDLPDDLRAVNPDEVGTILLLSCTSKTTGIYTGGGMATTETCELKIVDATIPEVIGAKTFDSERPPSTTNNRLSQIMRVKSHIIIKYLLSLPRK
jgi:hypothetical protein